MRIWKVLVLICNILLFNGILYSQNNEFEDSLKYETDEVIITGTRTFKKLIDIPFSVERIDKSEYKYDRNIAINDVLGTVPGLFMQSRYGNHDVRVSIRGFGSRSNSGIRGVRILLDDIPESEPDGQTRIESVDFESIGSIEIVKGNASSLYTNAPGGVINFKSDINFPKSFLVLNSEFGEFNLRRNGYKLGVNKEDYNFLSTYSYHNFKGYREHSEDYWHILNTGFQTNTGEDSRLLILGYYVNGLIRLPGSLTKEQYESDPLQANSRDLSRDSKRISEKGRLGIRFNTHFGKNNNNEFEITTYGTVKYFERTARTYRIFNRYGIGGSIRLVNNSKIFNRNNEFSIGGDVFLQKGPIEEYENINGKKSDVLLALTDEKILNVGFYFQNDLNIIPDRLNLFVTGRYDKIGFDQRDQLFEVRNAIRSFEDFTPKIALNYKITPYIAVYTSYGSGFDTPAGNELENYPYSSDGGIGLLNPDLQPQKSRNFEIGIKGHVLNFKSKFFRSLLFDATIYNLKVKDEVIPFSIDGDVFYRNAAQTTRNGFELGFRVEVFKNLRLKSSYTFSQFTYDEYIARLIDFDDEGNLITTDSDFSGNMVPSIPKSNLSIDLSYEHNLSRKLICFIKGNYSFIDNMYVDDANSENTEKYNLLNSSFGAEFNTGKFSLLLNAGLNNILNKKYVGFITINADRKEFYEAGETRNFFLGLKLGYRM